MPRKLIHAINILFLAIVLIVLPAAVFFKIFSWRVSSAEMLYQFTLVGLGAALFYNLALLTLVRMRKSRRVLCLKWSLGQAILGLLFFLMWRGTIHFDWLRRWFD